MLSSPVVSIGKRCIIGRGSHTRSKQALTSTSPIRTTPTTIPTNRWAGKRRTNAR
jgi:hypothetical protein